MPFVVVDVCHQGASACPPGDEYNCFPYKVYGYSGDLYQDHPQYSSSVGVLHNTIGTLLEDGLKPIEIFDAQTVLRLLDKYRRRCCPKGDTFQSISVNEGLLYPDVKRIVADPENGIWILSSKGLSFYDGDNFSTYEQDSLFQKQRAMVISDTKDVYIATNEGLMVLEKGTESFSKVKNVEIIPNSLIYDFRQKALYLIDQTYLYSYKNKKLKKIAASPFAEPLKKMSLGSHKSIWIHSLNNIWHYKFDGKSKVYNASR